MKKIFVLSLIACICFMHSAGYSPAAEQGQSRNPVVRVCLVDDQESLTLYVKGKYTISDADTGKALLAGDSIFGKVTVFQDGFMIGERKFDRPKIRVEAEQDANIFIDNKSFRGAIDIVKKLGGKFMVINRLSLEKYLYGVLRKEVSPYWPLELLKAQAIVARTFALYESRKNIAQPYDLRSDIYSQVYGGKDSERWTTTRAVNLTANQVLAYNGSIFPAYYHATCGGYTESASNLWNIDIPPLKGVPCRYCYNSKHYRWTKELKPGEVEQKLKEELYNIGKVVSMTVVSRNKSKRVDKLAIKDDRGVSIVMAGKKFRQMVGPNDIRSTNFYILKRYGRFLIHGFGWGHGAGMCQWGAYIQAKDYKKTAEEILQYYYPGAKITTIDKLKEKL